jgi:shikimate kinase
LNARGLGLSAATVFLQASGVQRPRQLRNLALVGFMGVGKTSVGHALAEALQFEFLDTDAVIEERTGQTITQIFTDHGEAHFRALETQLVAELATREQLIISCGGGLAANQANLDALKSFSLVICLWASPEKILARVRHQAHRPLLHDPDPLAKIKALLAAREPFYRQADVMVNTELRSVKAVAQQIAHQFRLERGGGK